MGGCNGNCASCSGCGRELELTKQEIAFLRELGAIPFLPVCRSLDQETPVYPEAKNGAEMSLMLQCLEKKGLISLDYDQPLKGFHSQVYSAHAIRGSMALTQRGQQVLELMEYQGVREA